MKNISILGCGWLGMPLANHLKKLGYRVKGSTTTPKKRATISENGAQPFLVDIHNLTKVALDFFNSEVLVVCIVGKNIDSFKALNKTIQNTKVQKVIFISSTSVYETLNTIVTEKTPTLDTPLRQIEQLFQENKSIDTTVIRFGGLFGHNRKPGNFFPKSGTPMKNPEGTVNLIHQDDCVELITKIIKQGVWGEVFNACADTHPTRREFYTKERAKITDKEPLFDEQSENKFKSINSDKIKACLNYTFKYADLMEL